MRAIRQALLRGCESSVMDCIHGIPKQDICIMCIMHTYAYASCVYVYKCIRADVPAEHCGNFIDYFSRLFSIERTSSSVLDQNVASLCTNT